MSASTGIDALIVKVLRSKEATIEDYRAMLGFGESIIPAIVREWRTGNLRCRADEVALVLESFGEPAIPALIEMLPKSRRASCALQEMGPQAARALGEALHSEPPHESLMEEAMETLEYMAEADRDIREAEPAIRRLRDDPDIGSRAQILLERIGREVARSSEASGVRLTGNEDDAREIDLLKPSRSALRLRQKALNDAKRLGKEVFIWEHLEYFHFLVDNRVELPTSLLIEILEVSASHHYWRHAGIAAMIAEQLRVRHIDDNADLARALTAVLSNVEHTEEHFSLMVDLLGRNAHGQMLAPMAVKIYQDVCETSRDLSRPMEAMILGLGGDAVAALTQAVRSGSERAEKLEALLNQIDPEKAMEVKVERLVRQAKSGEKHGRFWLTKQEAREDAICELAGVEHPCAVAALEQFRDVIEDRERIRTDLASLHVQFAKISERKLKRMRALRSKGPQYSSRVEKRKNVPVLISLLLDPKDEGQQVWAAQSLSQIRPVDDVTVKVLALVWRDSKSPVKVKDASAQAILTLGPCAVSAVPYLRTPIFLGDVNAARCIARIGPPCELAIRVMELLSENIRSGREQAGLEELLLMGETARGPLLSLVNEGLLTRDQTEQVLAKFGMDDRVAVLIAVLKHGTETERLEAATELETTNDSRTREFLAQSAESLSTMRLRKDVEFTSSPERLQEMRDKILKALGEMRIAEKKEFVAKWSPKPIIEISGKEQVAEWLITKIQDEAKMIITHVYGIKDLQVGCIYGRPGVAQLMIHLWRRFANGNADFIPHGIVRTGKDRYTVGYSPM